MRLMKMRIRGFQSFADSGEVEFSEGINLIIGQNNAGKTALLRALRPNFPDDRHRTPEKWENHRLSESETDLTIDVSGTEIRDWILRSGAQQQLPVTEAARTNVTAFLDEFFERPKISISVVSRHDAGFAADYPSHRLFHFLKGTQRYHAQIIPRNGKVEILGVAQGNGDMLPGLLWHAWQRELFYFDAERMTFGDSPHGRAVRLTANAANLPNVLHTLSAERSDVFSELVRHLREVFPTVGNLTVRTMPNNTRLEVLVWPTEARDRPELSFPLNSSGTGVAQLIALLTAVMTIDNGIIIIDEINSFLHPAAVKALLRIMQTNYSHHQYIIATHAPEVINFSNPKTVHLVKREGYESSVERLDLGEVAKLRDVAEHLGVSMADVFAAERIIWVEGQSEELCFPYLYQKLLGMPLPRGTIITAVAATGDFITRRRDCAIVYEVYRRLSAAGASLAVQVVFSFDAEQLTESEKEEMRSKAAGMLYFLPRRHLECYLVDPAAIATFIGSKDSALAGTITSADVEAAISKAAAEHPFRVPEWNGAIANEGWLTRVDAAKLIDSVCGTLSEQRVRFGKNGDSLFLLQHIANENPEQLRSLGDYVEGLVAAAQRSGHSDRAA